jgi:hypothetical protein
MPISMQHERDNVFRLDVCGTLRKTELDRCQEGLAGEIERLGSVRLLFVLDGFNGWEPGAPWNDLSFFVRYGDAIERIAILGPEKWRSQMLMFAGADLRKAPVEYFPVGTAAEARGWLSS